MSQPAAHAAPRAPQTPQDALRDFRTAQIVDAARRVFGRVGYAEASIDRIAREAGVGRSTVYVYFESKEAILDRCLARGREQLLAAVGAALAATRGAEPRLAALVGRVLAHVDENRRFFQAVSVLEAFGPLGGDAGSEELEGLRRAFEELLDPVFAEAVDEGLVAPGRAAEARRLLAILIHGAAALRVRSESPPAPDAEAARLAGVLLHGVGPRGRRPE